MKVEEFILKILKKIESLKEGVVAYAYQDSNAPKTYFWWTISVSDIELYSSDKRFKNLTNAWHKVALSKGWRIVFVCGWMPTEEKLAKLAEEENLILNI